jgi:predicted amidohydrolase
MLLGIAVATLAAASLLQAADIQFRIAGLSMTPTPWDKAENFARLERLARDAAARGANLIATPEGFLEGYVGNIKHSPGLTPDRYSKAGEEIGGPLLTKVAGLARELKVYLLVGFAERRDGRTFNTAVIFSPDGKVALRYAKSHTADDEPYNTKGVEFPVIDTPFGRWGSLICYDRQLPETSRILALKGARVVLIPAWGGYGEMNDIMMRVRAYENGVWLAFIHPNRFLLIDPRGNIVAESRATGDLATIGDVALRDSDHSKLLDRRRPELYRELTTPARIPAGTSSSDTSR